MKLATIRLVGLARTMSFDQLRPQDSPLAASGLLPSATPYLSGVVHVKSLLPKYKQCYKKMKCSIKSNQCSCSTSNRIAHKTSQQSTEHFT